jgi:cytochrome P450
MNLVALAKTDEWIDQTLRPLIAEGKSFNVGSEMINLLLQSISETAFEYTMSPQEVEMFKRELDLNMTEFAQKSTKNPFRNSVFGNLLPGRRRAKVSARRLQDHGLKIIESYRGLKKPVEGTIIKLIMTNPCYQNDKERAADVLAMMIAGHDTTAYKLAWTLKELAQNSEIQSQLRQSIQMAQRKGEDPSQLELVRTVIREGIRLHPVSASGPIRKLGRDFVTKEGTVMPAGSIVFLPIITLHRDPSIFGKDWDQFKPDRLDKANVTNEMNQALLPFSVGRQNCVGQPLANAELQCMLPRIISQFELTIDQPGTAEYVLTLRPVNTMLTARAV